VINAADAISSCQKSRYDENTVESYLADIIESYKYLIDAYEWLEESGETTIMRSKISNVFNRLSKVLDSTGKEYRAKKYDLSFNGEAFVPLEKRFWERGREVSHDDIIEVHDLLNRSVSLQEFLYLVE